MAIKEGEHLLDDGDTTLSSSELDDVLSSAEFQDMDAGDDSLEQYGVWVKVKPENIAAGDDADGVLDLSDLDAGGGSGLTAEEEDLLGELEDEPLDAGEFEGLEADLEELGRSVHAEGPTLEGDLGAGDLELSVEDLDADLNELSFEDGNADAAEVLGSMDDLDLPGDDGGFESLEDLTEDQEIEVPLSESAAVEEHFGAGVGPAAQVGAGASADILERIEADLGQIKSEIQTLKRELTSIGRAGAAGAHMEVPPVPEGPPGFFNQEEDETIALTGDELDNILNTADITEETAEPVVEDAEEELPELDEDVALLDLDDAEAPSPAPARASAPGEEEDILELGGLDLEEEQPSEAMSEIEIDIGGPEDIALELEQAEPGGLEPGGLEPSGSEPSGSEPGGDEDLVLSDLDQGEQPVDFDLQNLAIESPGTEEGGLILEDLADAPEDGEELLLEEVEGGGMDVEELTLDVGGDEPQAGLEELELEEISSSGDLDTLEPAAEPLDDLGDQIVELEEAAGESVESLDLVEDLDTVDFEELGAAEAEEELATLPDAELSLGQVAEGEPEGDLLELEELAEVGDEPLDGAFSIDEPELALEDAGVLELPGEPEELEALETPPAAPGEAHPRGTGAMTKELKEDVSSVLTYLDQLLEALPEEKIREFAQSEYFATYKRLFDELGLGA